MAFKVFTAATLTAADVNDHLAEQSVIVCTSATRPTPQEGMTIYETDTDTTLVYVAAWSIVSEPPQTWNVTSVNQSGAKSCTTSYGWYQRSRGMFVAQLTLTGFAAGSAGSSIQVATPVTLTDANAVGGSFHYFDSGTSRYAGTVTGASTSAVVFIMDAVGDQLGITPSIALAAADSLQMTIHGRYA